MIDAILRPLLESHKRRTPWYPANERTTLRSSIPGHLDGYTIRLDSFRVDRDGNMIRSTFRHAADDIDMRSLYSGSKYVVIREVDSVVSYLWSLLFPRPLPRFRIRRDAKRLTGVAVPRAVL